MCTLTMLTSCIKHEVFNTEHPDSGALVVTTDFSEHSAEALLPASYIINVGQWQQKAEGETNVFDRLLAPQTYDMLVYNEADGISISDGQATVNALIHNGRQEIEPTPGYLFGSFQQISIAEDDTTRVRALMRQYIKRLNVSLNVKEGDYSRVEKAECTLSGVETSVSLLSSKLSGVASSITNSLTQEGSRMSTFFRILGIVPTAKQTLTLTLTYTNGDQETIDSDITDLLDDTNNDDDTSDIDINGTIILPLEAGFSATIEGWNEARDGFEAQ